MSAAPAPAVTPELRQVLRRLKLGKMLDTLPERLALAKHNKLAHAAFLELVLADEVDRRDRTGATQRTRTAGLDPAMTLEAWEDHDAITYDHDMLAELATLRFVEDRHCAFVLGPVGVGKTHLAHALGHIACRRRNRVVAQRADRLFKRLKAARLDNSHEAEMRRLIGVDLLIIDDFALHALDAVSTGDFWEIAVERHLSAATVLTSNREPIEWLAQLADPLLAQSAIDRLQSSAYELVIEGESYRLDKSPPPPRGGNVESRHLHVHHHRATAEHHHNPVPTSWRNPGPNHVASDITVEARVGPQDSLHSEQREG